MASSIAAPGLIGDPVDASTVEELVRANLPLVGHLVRELLGRLPSHISRDELTSAGMFALVTSAQGFDPSRGVPFARFATIRIRGALTDELRSMDWASRGVRSKAREIDTATSQLTGALGRTPTREEIAEVMGCAVADLEAVEADVHRAATLSVEGLHEVSGVEIRHTASVGPEGMLLHREQIGLLHDAIAELPDRLRIVVEEYFYGDKRMADIAAELGVTESRVSQLRSEALALLRAGMEGADAVPTSSAPDDRLRMAEPAIPAIQQRPGSGLRPGAQGLGGAADHAGAAASASAPKPTRRQVARAAYIAAVAARSTLAVRLATTTVMGETHASDLTELRAAQ